MAGGTDNNVLLVTDSYKVTHHVQYPENTTHVYSYFESRGGKFPKTVFFGLQYLLKRWLVGPVVTKEKILEAKEIYNLHFKQEVFNEKGWNYILQEHNGYLPLRIKAVPEGTVVPYKNVLFTVENTDPKCFWLTNYFETLLVQVWYPMTVATNSYYQKDLIAKCMQETADDFSTLPYMLHDFGFRGSTSVEEETSKYLHLVPHMKSGLASYLPPRREMGGNTHFKGYELLVIAAGIGGCAHLINFLGTDTIAALTTAKKYYNCDIAGYSIPAAEHSTITTWGKDGEVDGFRNMMEKFPNGIVACVSDSYNIWNACEKLWGEELKDIITKRGERDARLVVRPDSGNPSEVVIKVLEILGRKFGTSTNSKGYKLLPSYIRVIQGDGVSYETLEEIGMNLKKHSWSIDNVTFGSGGALLQKIDRDTQKCAYKCSAAIIDGKEISVFKQPITDTGKKSKKGRLTLEYKDNQLVTVQRGKGDPNKDILIPVFENGKLLQDCSMDEIRARAEIDLLKKN